MKSLFEAAQDLVRSHSYWTHIGEGCRCHLYKDLEAAVKREEAKLELISIVRKRIMKFYGKPQREAVRRRS